MSVEEFRAISLLPLPLLDVSKTDYKSFAEVGGQGTPSERDKPSLQPVKCSESEDVDKANRQLLSQSGKVRALVQCGDYFKPC